MDANNAVSENSEIFLEFAHKAVVGEADKLLTLAKLLRIPLDWDKVHQYLNAVRAVKPNRYTNSLESKGDYAEKELIDFGNNLSEVTEPDATYLTEKVEDILGLHQVSVDENEAKLHQFSCYHAETTENYSKPEHIKDKSIASDIREHEIPKTIAVNIAEEISQQDTEMLIPKPQDDNTERKGKRIRNNNVSRFIKSTLETLNILDTDIEQCTFEEKVKKTSTKGSLTFAKASATVKNPRDNSEHIEDPSKQEFSHKTTNNEKDQVIQSADMLMMDGKLNSKENGVIKLKKVMDKKNFNTIENLHDAAYKSVSGVKTEGSICSKANDVDPDKANQCLEIACAAFEEVILPEEDTKISKAEDQIAEALASVDAQDFVRAEVLSKAYEDLRLPHEDYRQPYEDCRQPYEDYRLPYKVYPAEAAENIQLLLEQVKEEKIRYENNYQEYANYYQEIQEYARKYDAINTLTTVLDESNMQYFNTNPTGIYSVEERPQPNNDQNSRPVRLESHREAELPRNIEQDNNVTQYREISADATAKLLRDLAVNAFISNEYDLAEMYLIQSDQMLPDSTTRDLLYHVRLAKNNRSNIYLSYSYM